MFSASFSKLCLYCSFNEQKFLYCVLGFFNDATQTDWRPVRQSISPPVGFFVLFFFFQIDKLSVYSLTYTVLPFYSHK